MCEILKGIYTSGVWYSLSREEVGVVVLEVLVLNGELKGSRVGRL